MRPSKRTDPTAYSPASWATPRISGAPVADHSGPDPWWHAVWKEHFNASTSPECWSENDQLGPAEPALLEAGEETAPERLVLAVADVESQHLTWPVGGVPVATTTAIDTTSRVLLRMLR
ncbi:hypothetical protein GCM10023350_03210 [Nocardioides endophyticus]|uniref:Uncharacterized protein n=1 Tax=Nocardioides endophyticus TaxID=1353775 RepID=A0ABP8YC13_9ACTN